MSAPEGRKGRGRPPKGSGLVDGLEGSEHARERLRLILGAMTGEISVNEACRQLGIGPARFHELRTEMLQAGLSRLEPGQAGRPPKRTDEEAAEVAALKRENQELKVDLQASRLREEIAIAMPGLLDKSVSAGLQKKRPAKPQG
jgi:transposase-like protein